MYEIVTIIFTTEMSKVRHKKYFAQSHTGKNGRAIYNWEIINYLLKN